MANGVTLEDRKNEKEAERRNSSSLRANLVVEIAIQTVQGPFIRDNRSVLLRVSLRDWLGAYLRHAIGRYVVLRRCRCSQDQSSGVLSQSRVEERNVGEAYVDMQSTSMNVTVRCVELSC